MVIQGMCGLPCFHHLRCADSRSAMLGMDVRTGAIVTNWYLQPGDIFAGPLAIDPLSLRAYTSILTAR